MGITDEIKKQKTIKVFLINSFDRSSCNEAIDWLGAEVSAKRAELTPTLKKAIQDLEQSTKKKPAGKSPTVGTSTRNTKKGSVENEDDEGENEDEKSRIKEGK